MKRFSFTAILVSTIFLAIAQTAIKPKAGINFSSLNKPGSGFYARYDNQAVKLGFHAGVAFEFTLKDELKLQAEILYNQKGLRDQSKVPVSSTSNLFYQGYGYRWHYIELPLLFRYAVPKQFSVGIGPSIAYMAGTDFFLGGKKTNFSQSKLSHWEGGLNGEVAYKISCIELGLRYSHGFSTVKQSVEGTDPEIDMILTEPVGENRNFQFSIAYILNK